MLNCFNLFPSKQFGSPRNIKSFQIQSTAFSMLIWVCDCGKTKTESPYTVPKQLQFHRWLLDGNTNS